MNHLPWSSQLWHESACYHHVIEEAQRKLVTSPRLCLNGRLCALLPQRLCPVGCTLKHPLPHGCSQLGYLFAKGMHGVPKAGLRREHVQAEGLDFCHCCSELDLVCLTLRHSSRLQEARGSQAREASACLPRALLLNRSPSQAGKQVTTPGPQGCP